MEVKSLFKRIGVQPLVIELDELGRAFILSCLLFFPKVISIAIVKSFAWFVDMS